MEAVADLGCQMDVNATNQIDKGIQICGDVPLRTMRPARGNQRIGQPMREREGDQYRKIGFPRTSPKTTGPNSGIRLSKLLPRLSPTKKRSEERRVGKECRSRWSAYYLEEKGKIYTESRLLWI